MSSSNEIILKVRGKSFGGWTSVQVEKSLMNVAGAFGLAATDIYPGNAKKWGIAMGDECTVEINGQTIITGYVEDIPITYDANNHNIQIGGRDKTGDLVDCSFDGDNKEFVGQSASKVITEICSPFSISIVVDSSVSAQAAGKLETFKINEGDTAFDLISKICHMKAMLPVSYGDGKLTLTRAGTTQTKDTLELGRNVKSGSLDQSDKERFKTYIVKGQGLGADTKSFLPVFTSPGSRATDDVISRYRPIIIFTETPCDEGKCLERAKWERDIRAGKSRSLEYEVQGWTQSNGDVWPLNALVRVKDAFLEIDATMLIAAVSYKIDEQGTITKLLLTDPEAFELIEKKYKAATGFDWGSFAGE